MPLAPPLALLLARPAPADSTTEDVRAAQSGDLRAFERLYRAHVGKVYALCLRLTADVPRAEQLTQDCFVRAWERLSSFREESPFAGWLRQVAVNTVMADLRAGARRTRRVLSTDDEAILDAPSAPAQPGDRLDLEKAIATLPANARAVFVLHDVEGYAHFEIAALMGIAEGTSKAHLHTAREKLKEVLR